MPEICRFFGIVIQMYFADHGPPHFHARYGSTTARIQLSPMKVMATSLPPRALRLVLEWANLREAELLENWRLVQLGEAPRSISPLE